MWTDEKVANLKKLWLEGLSAREVAGQLGGVTRNAVIGKVHRLGLSARGAGASQPRRTRPARPVKPRRASPGRPWPNRGQDKDDKDRVVGVNCVSWSHGLNEKVIMRGLAKGCEVMVTGYFIDTQWEAHDGTRKYAKELVVRQLCVLDWAERADQRAAA